MASTWMEGACKDRIMTDDLPADYLAGLPAAQREELARVNGAGLAALRRYLPSGQAAAFLGAGCRLRCTRCGMRWSANW